MVARLLLALFILVAAIPTAAMPSACHDVSGTAPQGVAAVHQHGNEDAPAREPATTAHLCLGCIPLADLDGAVIERSAGDGSEPTASLARMTMGSGPVPISPPPRAG